MSIYARNTSVSEGRSVEEIMKILTRYGADQFIQGHRDGMALVGFRLRGKAVKMMMPVPQAADMERTGKGRPRRGMALEKAVSQARRQRWRSLALTIKAKLEAVQTGVAQFETEWLPYFVLPGGMTVAEMVLPKMEKALTSGEPVDLFPMLPAPRKEKS